MHIRLLSIHKKGCWFSISFMHDIWNVLGEGNWAAAQPVRDNIRALLVAIYLVRELAKLLASQL